MAKSTLDSRFTLEKSISKQVIEVIVTIFDLISCIVVGIPLVLQALHKTFLKNRKDIRGQLALVTGGGNGLGREICLKLAAQGCNIGVVDIDGKAAEQTAEEIRDLGLKAKAYKVDVTSFVEIVKLRDDLRRDIGPVDILVNNAGLMSNKNLEEKPEHIEQMIKVNVLGPILMSKCFLEQMKEMGSGHIVSISSMSGLHATPFSIPYSATKFGINGFMAALTEYLRLEKWRSRIKTTCVFPYYIKTRQDVIDFLHPDIRFPPLEIDETASEVVQGILREDFTVSIPSHQKAFVKFISIFPLSVQELVRDRLVREYQFRDPACKLNFGNE